MIQIFIVIIGILFCIVGYNGVRKYYYNKYEKKTEYNVVYNNYSNVSFLSSFVDDEVTTTTTSTTTTAVQETTNVITTTTRKKETIIDAIQSVPIIEDDGNIIYDGLTLTQLTDKLNKNLNSTLSNTGYYFAEYTKKTGLDPYLAVAIVLHETGCKWTCSSLVRDCNNIGGMKGSGTKCNSSGYLQYNSLEEGINGYLDMLYNNYYSKGLTTAELMNSKYAASTTWSANINKYIDEIRAS